MDKAPYRDASTHLKMSIELLDSWNSDPMLKTQAEKQTDKETDRQIDRQRHGDKQTDYKGDIEITTQRTLWGL